MFGKAIVFGLFKIIQKKKKKSEDRVLRSGFGLQVGLGTSTRAITFQSLGLGDSTK